ncbi:hypothetical protein LZ31DRAFT_584872, partial [Colletotrichum somersetense]
CPFVCVSLKQVVFLLRLSAATPSPSYPVPSPSSLVVVCFHQSINQSVNQPPILRCLTHPHSFLRPLPFLYHPRFSPSLLLLSFALFCRPHPSPDNVFDKSSSTSSRLRQESYTAKSILGFSTCAPLSRGKGSFPPRVDPAVQSLHVPWAGLTTLWRSRQQTPGSS